MPGRAYVIDAKVLAEFASALSTFGAQGIEALSAIDRDIQRTVDWLEEQRQTWVRVVRKVEEDFQSAKRELARRKMMRIGDRPVATSDQELAFRRAKARLEYAQGKLDRTHEWQRLLPQLILDHEAPVLNLKDSLETDVPRMRAFLEQKIEEVNRYAREK